MQKISGEKESPWKIPLVMLVSPVDMRPVECGRWIFVCQDGIVFLMKLIVVSSVLYVVKASIIQLWGMLSYAFL